MNSKSRLRQIPLFLIAIAILTIVSIKWNGTKRPIGEIESTAVVEVERHERQPSLTARTIAVTPTVSPTTKTVSVPQEIPVLAEQDLPTTRTLIGYVVNGRTGEKVSDFDVSFFLTSTSPGGGEVSRINEMENAFRVDYTGKAPFLDVVVTSPDIAGSARENIFFWSKDNIAEKTFALFGDTILKGRILWGETGQPVSNALVSATWNSGIEVEEVYASTTQHGFFELEGIPASWRKGLSMEILPEDADSPYRFETRTRSGEVDDLGEIPLPQLGTLTVQVINVDGEPESGKSVRIQNSTLYNVSKFSPNSRIKPEYIEEDLPLTDQNGMIVYTGIYYPRKISVSLKDPEMTQSITWAEGDGKELSFIVGEASYTATVWIDDEARANKMMPGGIYLTSSGSTSTIKILGKMDAVSGAPFFHESGIPSGNYQRILRLPTMEKDGFFDNIGFCFLQQDDIEIDEAGYKEEFHLYTRELKGRFMDEAGQPVQASFQITQLAEGTTFSGGSEKFEKVVKEDGRFAIEKLPHGRMKLTASAAQGKVEKEFVIPPYPEPLEEMTFVFSRRREDGGSVLFTILDARNGDPIVDDLRIYLSVDTVGTTLQAGFHSQAKQTEVKNVYLVDNIPAGDYYYTIESVKYGLVSPRESDMIHVSENEHLTKELHLEPKSLVVVKVESLPTDMDGDIVYTLEPLSNPSDNSTIEPVPFSGNRLALFYNLDPGDYALEITIGERLFVRREFTLGFQEVKGFTEVYTGN